MKEIESDYRTDALLKLADISRAINALDIEVQAVMQTLMQGIREDSNERDQDQ